MLTDVQMLDRLAAAALEEQLCEDMRAEPDHVPVHHGNRCGCEGIGYPFFVCAHCLRLVPVCFGGGALDNSVHGQYVGQLCDECAMEQEVL